MRLALSKRGVLPAVALMTMSMQARAAVITVSPGDSAQANIAKIEGAAPGDEVVVEPGTYAFRLYLEGQGTASQPIIIRAADPNDRPVWDLSGMTTGKWPGSYSGGDNARGIWQVTGSHYQIRGIVFRGGTEGSPHLGPLIRGGTDEVIAGPVAINRPYAKATDATWHRTSASAARNLEVDRRDSRYWPKISLARKKVENTRRRR